MKILEASKNIFTRKIPIGKTWNMEDHQGWGNAINWSSRDFSDLGNLGVYGHLPTLPKRGDVLVSKFKNGVCLVFQFTKIKPCGNPRDMFFADVIYLGEQE